MIEQPPNPQTPQAPGTEEGIPPAPATPQAPGTPADALTTAAASAAVVSTGGAQAAPPYPARLEIDYPDELSRGLIFVKGLLLAPHFIALMAVAIGGFFMAIVAWFGVLFTGRIPQGAFNYGVGFQRWAQRVSAYQFLMTDAYPPFSMQDDPSYPVRVQIDYPPKIARWRAFAQGILAVPAYFAYSFLSFGAFCAVVAAWFAILFTKRFPRGMFDFITVERRWALRVTTYAWLMTEQYPPFVMA